MADIIDIVTLNESTLNEIESNLKMSQKPYLRETEELLISSCLFKSGGSDFQ